MHGMVVLKEGPGVTGREDLHTRLGPGALICFAPGSKAFNGASHAGDMKWVITMDGGTVDLEGLSEADRQKIILVQLPEEQLTDLTATVLAECGAVPSNRFAHRGTGTLRCFDAMGRARTAGLIGTGPSAVRGYARSAGGHLPRRARCERGAQLYARRVSP